MKTDWQGLGKHLHIDNVGQRGSGTCSPQRGERFEPQIPQERSDRKLVCHTEGTRESNKMIPRDLFNSPPQSRGQVPSEAASSPRASEQQVPVENMQQAQKLSAQKKVSLRSHAQTKLLQPYAGRK